jgi:histidinol-phosphate phosphatase family protein
MEQVSYVTVIPTIGRPCLQDCLDALGAASGPPPGQVVIADDRPHTPSPLPVTVPASLADRTTVVVTGGSGPAAARNAGWRAASPSEWVVFLDDDVRPGERWADELAEDLRQARPDVAGVQADIFVPPPPGRRPTDTERATLGLATAPWITADMAYRRSALTDTGAFDERFRRAFREDSDLALRAQELGWQLCKGRRGTVHPLRAGSRWASLRAQAGNADDALMRRLHGTGWHRRAGAASGRRLAHLAACGLAATAVGLLTTGHRRHAAFAAAGWLAVTAEFAGTRIARGPATGEEITAMVATSALIPPLAVGHWVRGTVKYRRSGPWPPPPRAVLFDRDGTLVLDVPYNGDPARVELMPGAKAAVTALRRAGIAVGVVTNQSGIGRGLLTRDQVDAVNQRVDELAGPLRTWQVCPHAPEDSCPCRKPAAGLITSAAGALGTAPADCVVIGDTAADVAAARAAGARAILVPTPVTLPDERDGVATAANLTEAVTAVLTSQRLPSWPAMEALSPRAPREPKGRSGALG